MAIGIFIGNSVGNKKSSSYWTQRLSLKYSSRSGLDLLETKSGSNLNAKIMPVVGKIDASNYAKITSANFGFSDSTGYIEVLFYYNGVADKTLYLFTTADIATAGSHIIQLYLFYGTFNFKMVGAVGGAFTNTLQYATLTTGWYKIRITSNGTSYALKVNDVDTSWTSVPQGLNNGKWFDKVANRDNICIGIKVINSNVFSDMSGFISYVDYNNTNKWVVTGFNKYVYDIISGLHLEWTGSSHAEFQSDIVPYSMSIGYSVWQKSGQQDEYVPYTSIGVPYDPSALLTGYTKFRDFPGSSSEYNLFPAKIGFNETSSADTRLAIFDRSNTTRQGSTSRSATFYDATSLATKCRYYSSPTNSPFTNEFSYLTLRGYFNAGYKHMVFPKRNTALLAAITEINVLDTDLSNNSLLQKALDYSNIKGFIAFGDSITAGPSATTRYSYLVAASKAIEEINKGVPSDAVQIELVARVGNLSAYAENSRIFILCGINDIDHIVNDSPLGTDAAFISAYNTIIDDLVSYGFVKRNIYISTLTWLAGDSYGYRDYVVPYNTLITNIAASKGVNLIDLYSVTANQASFYTGAEEIHPNATGHQAIATEILSRITWW